MVRAPVRRQAIGEPNRTSAEAAARRERLRQKFSLSTMTARIETIYRGALENRKERAASSALETDFSR